MIILTVTTYIIIARIWHAINQIQPLLTLQLFNLVQRLIIKIQKLPVLFVTISMTGRVELENLLELFINLNLTVELLLQAAKSVIISIRRIYGQRCILLCLHLLYISSESGVTLLRVLQLILKRCNTLLQ